jgi:hypothetical protein
MSFKRNTFNLVYTPSIRRNIYHDVSNKVTRIIHLLNDQPMPEAGTALPLADLALSSGISLLVSEGPLFESGYRNKRFPRYFLQRVMKKQNMKKLWNF